MIEANRRAWAYGEPYDQTARCYHDRTREWLWLRTMATPVLDAHGRPAYFNGLVVDVTAQKQAETALQEHLQLEQIIADISTEFIDLGPEQIDMAIGHALQTKGEFAAEASS